LAIGAFPASKEVENEDDDDDDDEDEDDWGSALYRAKHKQGFNLVSTPGLKPHKR
jgi:hypothetical protein